jgi:hypothetical protein
MHESGKYRGRTISELAKKSGHRTAFALHLGRIPIFTVRNIYEITKFPPGFTWGYSHSTPSGLGFFFRFQREKKTRGETWGKSGQKGPTWGVKFDSILWIFFTFFLSQKKSSLTNTISLRNGICGFAVIFK